MSGLSKKKAVWEVHLRLVPQENCLDGKGLAFGNVSLDARQVGDYDIELARTLAALCVA